MNAVYYLIGVHKFYYHPPPTTELGRRSLFRSNKFTQNSSVYLLHKLSVLCSSLEIPIKYLQVSSLINIQKYLALLCVNNKYTSRNTLDNSILNIEMWFWERCIDSTTGIENTCRYEYKCTTGLVGRPRAHFLYRLSSFIHHHSSSFDLLLCTRFLTILFHFLFSLRF